MKNKKETLNLCVLISGRGSNLKSIIENIKNGYLNNVELKVVIANRDAPGLKYAKEFGVPAFVIPRVVDGEKISIDEHDEKVMDELDKFDIELICLAGYLQVLGPKFVNKYKWRIMNIHPALLPAFQATIHAQKEAVEYGVKISGATVHVVDEGIDTGPIIIQATVPVKEDDSEETLSNRILEFEHIIYPKAIKMFSEGMLKIRGRKVIIKQDIDAEKIVRNSMGIHKTETTLRKIGVSENKIKDFLEKTESLAILIKGVTPREAMSIKQEMLTLGGDCAVPRECVLNSLVPLEVVVIGNKKQIKKLVNKLKNQVFNLPLIAKRIEVIIRK